MTTIPASILLFVPLVIVKGIDLEMYGKLMLVPRVLAQLMVHYVKVQAVPLIHIVMKDMK